MFKYLCLIVFLLSFIPIPINASENEIVIKSFRISGESSTDEYIEIYNPSNMDIDLSGWRLSKKTSSGNVSNLLTTFPAVLIEPNSRLIIAHENCTCNPDLKYSTSSSVSKDNTVVLFSDNGKTVIDKVGMGEASDFEGAPIKNPEKLEIYGRNDLGLDTNHNKNDFKLIYSPPKPKEDKPVEKSNASKKVKQKNHNARLIVTEFLPNPEGSDSENEFIEIKNVGSIVDIGGYYIADTNGSPKTYKIPEDTKLKKGGYLAFYSSKTPISLNNKGDGIEVLDPDKKVIDSSTDDCGKAPEGASYALSKEGWVWTKTPTPGKANIINVVNDDEDDDETDSEVLSMIDESSFDNDSSYENSAESKNDKMFGIVLIVVAIIGAISYTLYANKEKVFEIYNKFRKRNDSIGDKIRKKLKRR